MTGVQTCALPICFPVTISLDVFEFPIDSNELEGKTFRIEDTDEETYTEVDLYDDEEAYLYENELSFSKDEEDVLQLFLQGKIDDFYTGSDEPIPFKLKCHFKADDIEIEE